MALVFDESSSEVISLEEFVHYVETEVDVHDPASLMKVAPKLQALARQKAFFFDKLAEVLADRCALEAKNLYTPQIFLIAERRDFFVRAVVWPELGSEMIEDAQLDLGYTDPHDHNFDFLTVGLFGPGYTTHIFEYDYASTLDQKPGDKVSMRFAESLNLAEGRCIYFRKSKDIHIQAPPASLSVSLNLIVNKPASARPKQNFFDLEQRTLVRSESPYALGILFSALDNLEKSKWLESVERIAEAHPDFFWRNKAKESLSMVESQAKDSL